MVKSTFLTFYSRKPVKYLFLRLFLILCPLYHRCFTKNGEIAVEDSRFFRPKMNSLFPFFIMKQAGAGMIGDDDCFCKDSIVPVQIKGISAPCP